MADEITVVAAFSDLVKRYHESRDSKGIDAPETEWVRAQISGVRTFLAATMPEEQRKGIYQQVRAMTGKGIPHLDREWMGFDSEAQRER